MSSHREAPSISQDPGRRQRRHLRVRQPGRPVDGHDHHELRPARGPPGGPNFFEFGDDVLYSIYVDNDGDALPEIKYQFRFRTTYQNPDTFLYNTGPISVAHRPELEQAAALLGLGGPLERARQRRRSQDAGQGAREEPRVPAVQHRAALDPELRRPRRGGRASPAVRRDGVRRPAERRLLRRPRRDLRPRRHQGAPEPPPDPDGERRRASTR